MCVVQRAGHQLTAVLRSECGSLCAAGSAGICAVQHRVSPCGGHLRCRGSCVEILDRGTHFARGCFAI